MYTISVSTGKTSYIAGSCSSTSMVNRMVEDVLATSIDNVSIDVINSDTTVYTYNNIDVTVSNDGTPVMYDVYMDKHYMGSYTPYGIRCILHTVYKDVLSTYDEIYDYMNKYHSDILSITQAMLSVPIRGTDKVLYAYRV